jgi:hypothetical protein
MAQVGRNPARIIPVWRDFVDRQSACQRGVRGIGEPISADRSADEVIECQRHESLLNLAFADDPSFDLLCPYDTSSLQRQIIDELHTSHPSFVQGAREHRSDAYPGVDALGAPFNTPLPAAPADAPRLRVDASTLADMRAVVRGRAQEAGIDEDAIDDLLNGVNELACNSIRQGGGEGLVRVWRAASGWSARFAIGVR